MPNEEQPKYVSQLKVGNDNENAQYYKIRDDEAQAAITRLNNTVETLGSDLSGDGTNTGLATRVTTLETRLNNQENVNHNGSFAKNIADLQTQNGSVNIASIAASITAAIVALNTVLTTLNTYVGNYSSRSTLGKTMAGEIAELQDAVDTINETLANFSGIDDTAVNTLIANSDLANTVGELSSQIYENSDSDSHDTLKGTVTKQGIQLNVLDDMCTDLFNDLGEVETISHIDGHNYLSIMQYDGTNYYLEDSELRTKVNQLIEILNSINPQAILF